MMSFKRNERRLSLTILVIFALSLLAFPVFSLGTPAVQDDMPALSQHEGDVYVSIDGDDEEGTGSAENPYRTIQKGVDEADAEGVVRVLAGYYEESVTIGKSVSIIGDGWKRTHITNALDPSLIIEDQREEEREEPLKVWIEGMEISEGDMGITSFDVQDLNITVMNCRLEGNDRGAIMLMAEKNIEAAISGNFIYNNEYLDCWSGGGIRMGCYGESIGWSELVEEDPVPKITADIRNNVIAENHGGGIRLGWWCGQNGYTDLPGDISATIVGNRIYNNDDGSLRVKSARKVDVTVTDNDFQLTEEDLDACGVIRIGLISCSHDNDISEKVKAEIRRNVINCGRYRDYVDIGGVIRVNGQEIDATVSENQISAGEDVGGLIRIGLSEYHVATDITAVVTDNMINLDTCYLGGGIRIYATDTVDATVTGNRIEGMTMNDEVPHLRGGGMRIGEPPCWGDYDNIPAEIVKVVVSGNYLSPFAGGGIRIIASEEIEAEVNNNVISECFGGAIRVGWFCYDHEWENAEGEMTDVTPIVNAEITGNTLIDNHAVGIHLEGSDSVSGIISGNKVLGTQECMEKKGPARYNNPGIYVGNGDAAEVDVTVNNNAIAGNITGLINETDFELDATLNWWGNAYGPADLNELLGEIVGAGIFFEGGDGLIGNVNAAPWLMSEPPCVAPLRTQTIWFGEEGVNGIDGVLQVEVEEGQGYIAFAQYGDNPTSGSLIGDLGRYIDVYYEYDFREAGDVRGLFIKLFYNDEDLPDGVLEERLKLFWWNGKKWQECSDSGIGLGIIPTEVPGQKFAWAKITTETTPSLADLLGGGFAIGEPALYGDVYRDGKIDVKDAILVLKSIVGLAELNDIQKSLALVSGNDTLTVQDAILILKHIALLIEVFPVQQ